MHLIFLLYFWTLFKLSLENKPLHNLQKRFVLFPRYSVLQITAGMSIPAIFPTRTINLSFGLIDNRDLPFNISNVQPLYGRENAENVDFGRRTLYDYTIGIINTIGFDGHSCLLRSICETSEIPLYTGETPDENLLEKILHYLLTPSKDFGNHNRYDNTTLEYQVLNAEYLGRIQGNCYQLYKCPINLLDLFTNKYF